MTFAAWNSSSPVPDKSRVIKPSHVEVVVARPDRVDRGQPDVLVSPPVAGHVVVEHIDEGVGIEQERKALPMKLDATPSAPWFG